MSDNLSYILSTPGFRESRLSSLYSNFTKLKEVNPEGYDANLAAWCHIIPHLVKDKRLGLSARSIVLLDWSSVVAAVTIPTFGPPKELQLVLETLVNDNKMVPMNWFVLSGLHQDAWYSKLTLWFTKPKIRWQQELFICVAELKSLSEKVYNQTVIPAVAAGRILYSKKLLLQLVSDVGVTASDVELLLIHWSMDESFCTIEGKVTDENCYVKFDKNPITQSDKSVIDLNNQNMVLQQQIIDAESKIKSIDADIKKFIIDYKKDELNKLRVTNLLQLKHLLMGTLSKYLETSKLIQNLQTKLTEASSNLDIVSMLETSNKALTALNDKVNLEKLELLKDDIEENIDRTNQISDMMMDMSATGTDEQDIEDELQNLIDEQEALEKKEEVETLAKLADLKLEGVKDLGSQEPESDKEPKEPQLITE